jgi:hypothetical protein
LPWILNGHVLKKLKYEIMPSADNLKKSSLGHKMSLKFFILRAIKIYIIINVKLVPIYRSDSQGNVVSVVAFFEIFKPRDPYNLPGKKWLFSLHSVGNQSAFSNEANMIRVKKPSY